MRCRVSVHPAFIANEAFSACSPTECSVWAFAFLLRSQQSSQLDSNQNLKGEISRDVFEIGYKFHILIILFQSVFLFTQHLCK